MYLELKGQEHIKEIPAGSFDFVFLETNADDKTKQEANRVLRPGGTAVLMRPFDWHFGQLNSRDEVLAIKLIDYYHANKSDSIIIAQGHIIEAGANYVDTVIARNFVFKEQRDKKKRKRIALWEDMLNDAKTEEQRAAIREQIELMEGEDYDI